MNDKAERRELPARRPHLAIRTRLTLTYAGLVTGCGAVLIGIVYFFMRYVPEYAITSTSITSGTATPNPGAITHASAKALQHADYFDSLRATTFMVNSASDFLNVLLTISVVALILLAALSALVGRIVAGRVLKPLKAINEAATLAATGSLNHRIGPRGPRDEIRALAETFDSMLGALSRSFESHRRFAANASHELRTPLATTQTMIDVTLADPQADNESLRALARRIHTVNRENIRTVNSLLDLADIGQRPLASDRVDLGVLAAEAVTINTAEANEREVAVTLLSPSADGGPAMIISGDTVLLRQAIGNLVQNAVRHNRPHGEADLHLTRGDNGTVHLTVWNTGERIPDEIVDSLLEPFVRSAGRVTNTDVRGRGLGLAIAAGIAEAHGGALRLSAPQSGGLVAELTLPETRQDLPPH
ncbi:MAG: HAMP domain-containing sensor histidine kinase [Leifsonia sp.]